MGAPLLVAGVGTGSGTANATSSAIDTTGSEDCRVVVITQSASDPTVSDNKSNSWVKDGSSTLLNTSFTAWVSCWKPTGTLNFGTGHTFSANGTTITSVWAFSWKKSGAGFQLDVAVWNPKAQSGAGPYTSNSVTPSKPDALLLVFTADDGSGSPVTLTWTNSFVGISGGAITDHNNFWGGDIAQRTVNANGTYNSQASTNSTSPANAVIGILSITESIPGAPANNPDFSNFVREPFRSGPTGYL